MPSSPIWKKGAQHGVRAAGQGANGVVFSQRVVELFSAEMKVHRARPIAQARRSRVSCLREIRMADFYSNSSERIQVMRPGFEKKVPYVKAPKAAPWLPDYPNPPDLRFNYNALLTAAWGQGAYPAIATAPAPNR